MFTWETELKIALTSHIEKAVNEVNTMFFEGKGLAVFPYTGNDIYHIMADAAMTVMRGIADAEEFLKEDGMIKD